MKLEEFFENETGTFSVKTRTFMTKGPKTSERFENFKCGFQTKYFFDRGETNFSRSPKSQRFWQGAMYHVWTSHFDKHWRHSHFALSFLFNLIRYKIELVTRPSWLQRMGVARPCSSSGNPTSKTSSGGCTTTDSATTRHSGRKSCLKLMGIIVSEPLLNSSSSLTS